MTITEFARAVETAWKSGVGIGNSASGGATLGRRESVAMEGKVIAGIDKSQPAELLIVGNDVGRDALVVQHLAHVELGAEALEVEERDTLRSGAGVLVIVITSGRGAHLAAVEVVEAGSVVVAVETCRLVVGVGTMNVCTDEVEPVNLPAQAEPHGFKATPHGGVNESTSR